MIQLKKNFLQFLEIFFSSIVFINLFKFFGNIFFRHRQIFLKFAAIFSRISFKFSSNFPQIQNFIYNTVLLSLKCLP